jgi:hypothetical protein
LVEVEIVDIKKVELIALILPLINTAMTTFTERGVHIALDKRMTSLQGKMMDYDTRLMKIANFLIIAEGEEILWPMNLVKSNMRDEIEPMTMMTIETEEAPSIETEEAMLTAEVLQGEHPFLSEKETIEEAILSIMTIMTNLRDTIHIAQQKMKSITTQRGQTELKFDVILVGPCSMKMTYQIAEEDTRLRLSSIVITDNLMFNFASQIYFLNFP